MAALGLFFAEMGQDPLQWLLLLAVLLLAAVAGVCSRRWVLFRYVLLDLVKHFVLATTVLVLVISVALAIKPLSDGLLGPVGLVRFVLCSAPTMLQFAAPFSGAFAATMVFTRMSGDNEILACSAGGMSYRRILLPVVVLGLGLMLAMFYVGNWVAPRFYAVAVHSLETDVMQVLVNQMNKRQTMSLPGSRLILYADAGAEQKITAQDVAGWQWEAGSQPERWVHLERVVVAQVGPEGWLEHDLSAQAADAVIYRRGGQSYVRVLLDQAVRGDRSGRTMGVRAAQLLDVPLPVPLLDKPEAMSWPDLQQVRARPERYDAIARAKAILAQQVGADEVLGAIRRAMTGPAGAVNLVGPEDERYVLRSPGVQRQEMQLLLQAPVRVDHLVRGTVVQQEVAPAGTVTVALDPAEPWPQVTVTLRAAHSTNPALATVATDKAEFVLAPAFWQQPVLAEVSARPTGQLLNDARGDGVHAVPAEVARARDNLSLDWDVLMRKIKAQLHQRAAAALACLLVLPLGACWSMVWRDKLPLDVYGRCFLVVLLAVIVWIGGVHVTASPDYTPMLGVGVIWLGVALIAAAAARGYLRLARH
jgi:lipopolysaccharide export LptBFGC system permease protein LptF